MFCAESTSSWVDTFWLSLKNRDRFPKLFKVENKLQIDDFYVTI